MLRKSTVRFWHREAQDWNELKRNDSDEMASVQLGDALIRHVCIVWIAICLHYEHKHQYFPAVLLCYSCGIASYRRWAFFSTVSPQTKNPKRLVWTCLLVSFRWVIKLDLDARSCSFARWTHIYPVFHRKRCDTDSIKDI